MRRKYPRSFRFVDDQGAVNILIERKIMKIAVPTVDGVLCMHFGHCEKFVIIDVDEKTRVINGKEEAVPPPHEPGVIPKWLQEKGADVIIAGGMGMRAQQLFTQFGIKVITGAPADHPQTVALAWLDGTLATGSNACDH
jgi:ATP-binding protein involved in chromosome partitioning